jgi:hypothetical protein
MTTLKEYTYALIAGIIIGIALFSPYILGVL